MRLNDGECVTLEIAGADVSLKAAVVTEMFLDRVRGKPGELAFATLYELPPAIGAEWPSAPGWKYAGVARGENGEADAHVIAQAFPDVDDWKSSIEKAIAVNAQLPTRREAALCWANIPEIIGEGYAWTREPYAGRESYAWFQSFDNGTQDNDHKGHELRAFAVRRLPI